MKMDLPALLLGMTLSVSAQTFPGGYITAPFGKNGTWNVYLGVPQQMTWSQAKMNAERTELDLPAAERLGEKKTGHLLTVGSAAENMFAYQYVQGMDVWLGMTDDERFGGKEAEASRGTGWRWLTGEPVTFTSWRSAEPNSRGVGGEDAVAVGPAGFWNDWPSGLGGVQTWRFASFIEWDTESPEPVEGAFVIDRILPDRSLKDSLIGDQAIPGEGPWQVANFVMVNASNIRSSIKSVTQGEIQKGKKLRMERLNYHVEDGSFFAGGWLPIEDRNTGMFFNVPCSAYHVATIDLPEAGTWSISVHSDDYMACRVRGHRWKSVAMNGGLDPLDPETIYFDNTTGGSRTIGVIDLPAGKSELEIFLTSREFDGMLQVLATPGAYETNGATDQWRVPGYKAGGEIPRLGVSDAGWKVIRKEPGTRHEPLTRLMDGFLLPDDAITATEEGVAQIHYIDSDAPSNVEFPEPAAFPGDKPGNQDQFAIAMSAELVVPADGVYQIGFQTDLRCALRIEGQEWLRFMRDSAYSGIIEGDTIYVEAAAPFGFRSELVGEVELKKGSYPIECFYANLDGPTTVAVFGAAKGFAPYLLAKGKAGMVKDVDGLPLVRPAP